MYASIAGLKAHMQKLSVIGNNVANVNTQGYKKQRTVFRDGIYSMYSGGSNGTSTVGGRNPSQLGYGSMVGSIDLNMSSSSYNPGNPMDCALVGDGFFLVGDKEVAKSINPMDTDSLKSLTLTRVGDFKFGADGYLVDGKGNVVYGFMNTNEGLKQDPTTNDPTKTIPNISDQLVPIRLPHWEKIRADRTVTDPDNPDADPVVVEDYKYVMRYAETKEWTGNLDANGVRIYEGTTETKALEDVEEVPGAADTDPATALEFAKFSSISIDAGTGAITGICQEGDQFVTIGYLAIGSVTNPNGVSHIGNSYYRCQEGAGDLGISMLGNVNKDLGIWNVNSYMAAPANPDDPNAGNAADLPAGSEITGTATEMMTGFLEAPNTDLAEEISELITTQRGYQANTRIITVTDSMLEELVNMKR